MWILFSTPPPTQSSDFFSSSVWQFLSGIGAIIAIPIAVIATIIAFLAYRQQHQRKEITYEIVSDAPIISVNKALEGRIEILLDKNPVKNARLLIMNLRNSGNVSIRHEDYFEPIKFEFQKTTIISTDIIETQPQGLLDPQSLKTFLKVGANFVELPPFPLNPRDSIGFSILLSGSGKFQRRGRLDQGNITNLNKYQSIQKSLRRKQFIIALPLCFITLALDLIVPHNSVIDYILRGIFALIGGFIAYLLIKG